MKTEPQCGITSNAFCVTSPVLIGGAVTAIGQSRKLKWADSAECGPSDNVRLLIFHPVPQRIRCNANFNRTSTPSETTPVHRLANELQSASVYLPPQAVGPNP